MRFENLTSFLNHKYLRSDTLRCLVSVERGKLYCHSGRTVSRDTSLAAPTIPIHTLLDILLSIVSEYAPVVVQAIRSVVLRSLRRAYHDPQYSWAALVTTATYLILYILIRFASVLVLFS